MALNFSGIKFVLMDVEGTTSDIAFVKEVLFPYSAREMRNFVSQKRTNPVVRDCLAQTGTRSDDAAIEQLLQWIREDNKHPALKTLQGLIWERGFKEKAFKAHVYPEVLQVWQDWREKGLRLGIYSSGSITAQKLFFAHTEAGDLSMWLEANFDLSTGGKREATSYEKIAQALQLKPHEILFLSDVVEELDAAAAAGLKTVHVLRPGIESGGKHPEIKSFTELKLN
jgi:enolase-phosphatase E1